VRSKVNKVLKGELTTMSIDKRNDQNIPAHTEDYYEALASEEQIYLDEGVEILREREISVQDSSANNDPRTGESEPLHYAAEELIVGDSDDPPLSDEAVAKMLRKTRTA
jgi:hypothetical protein